MKSVRDAYAEVFSAFGPTEVVSCDLEEALGRPLAAEVRATIDLPAFDNSAMDGYAVRAQDLARASDAAPVALEVVGESRAGEVPSPLREGTAMRIFTGAPIPAGADAVVMQEKVVREGARALFSSPSEAGRFVRARASDLRAGERLLGAGEVLGGGELGLLASQDVARVEVHRRPRVALLSTGDELRRLGDAPRAGSIVDSNAYMLSALVREAGGEPWLLERAPDTLEATMARVGEALEGADVLVSCGGVSVGEHDFVREALEESGVVLDFWRVAMKPGKPLVFGHKGTRAVIGLPGNPVSAFVTFELFVRPGLLRMSGAARPHREGLSLPLERALPHERGRAELARAEVVTVDGRRVARPHRLQGSGSLPSVVGVDALLILEAEHGDYVDGEVVRGLDLRDRRGAARSAF